MGKQPSNVRMRKGLWSPEEDLRLINCIQTHGEANWRTVPLKAGLLRCGKACRLRWMNYLRPDIKRGNISADEEDLIFRLHKLVGNRWSLIAGRIPGRTDNEIKNHWNTHLSKRLVPLQNFKKRSDASFNNVGAAPWSSSVVMPPPLITSAMGISAGCENIDNGKNLSGSWSNLQLHGTMLGTHCNTQVLSNSTTMLTVESDNSLQPTQNFKKTSDGHDALSAIYDFSDSFKQMSDCYADHLLSSMPMPFISMTGTSAGYENIIEDIDSGENVVGRESNMQLRSTLVGAQYNFREEINDVEAKNGKSVVGTITAECCREPSSALSDWPNAPNDCTLSVEDYW